MKIISKFKDYYDYLLGKYGIDEKIVFDRTKVIDSPIECKLRFRFDRFRGYNNPSYEYRILVICGKWYILISKHDILLKTSDFRLVNEKDLKNKQIISDLRNLLPLEFGWFAKTENIVKILKENLKGVYREDLVDLSKKINTPIFIIIDCGRDVYLDQYTPNLSRIKGISSVYPANWMFPDLAFFIGNVLNNNEDNTHLIISDKDKIVKGGFDLKTSFRKM